VLSVIVTLWRLVPRPLRAFFWMAARPIAELLTPLRVRRWWRRGENGGEPVMVAGFHSSILGLGEGARLFALALKQGGFQIHAADLGPILGMRSELTSGGGKFEGEARTVISHLNPPELLEFLYRSGGRPLAGRRHVGYWAWELPDLPHGWKRAFRYVDEVWCPSAFTAEAVRKAAGGAVPVRVVPHPIFAFPASPDRRRFNFADGLCVVFHAFDLRSSAARKNPEAVLKAFERAGGHSHPQALLVLKVVSPETSPAMMAALRERLAGLSNVRLLTDQLSSPDMHALISSVDILLSLHRSEGFGLLAAQAMWAGKSVIATGWSGNMDFMDDRSSVLVPYRLQPVEDPQGIYAGALWAEPDVDVAAEALRRLLNDPEARADLGRRAAVHARTVFDRDRWLALVRRGIVAS
jgi:glycosyltransferase involved in cell wall biosynthesis